jgi:hypothetical protein
LPNELYERIQADLPPVQLLVVAFPSAKMFFRPEEVHGASSVRRVDQPSGEGEGNKPDDPFWIPRLELAVLDLDLYGFTAIEADSVDLYRLTREEPADR